MDYKKKYLKYKNKYLELKKIGGMMDDRDDGDDREDVGEDECDLEEDNPEIFNQRKFIISAHGVIVPYEFTANNKRYKTPFQRIVVPTINGFPVNIYFGGQYGECVYEYKYELKNYTCYEDTYSNYKVAPDTEDPRYIGKTHVNMFTSGDIINDFIIGADSNSSFSSFLGYCYKEHKYELINIQQEYFFSELLNYIIAIIRQNNIQGPYDIYCAFCLLNYSFTSREELIRDINTYNSKKPIISQTITFTENPLSNSR